MSRIKEALHFRESEDLKVKGASIDARTRRKQSAIKEFSAAEVRLKQKAIIGITANGKAGLNYCPSVRYDKDASYYKMKSEQAPRKPLL